MQCTCHVTGFAFCAAKAILADGLFWITKRFLFALNLNRVTNEETSDLFWGGLPWGSGEQPCSLGMLEVWNHGRSRRPTCAGHDTAVALCSNRVGRDMGPSLCSPVSEFQAVGKGDIPEHLPHSGSTACHLSTAIKEGLLRIGTGDVDPPARIFFQHRMGHSHGSCNPMVKVK